MRKLIVAAILLFAVSAEANTIAQIRAVLQSKRSGGGTSYIADANCQGAWYMNSDSTETDRSGNGNTLTESAGDDIPTSLTTPSGYSGSSRDFEAGNTNYLYRNDADLVGLDINGADAKISICAWVRLESDITYEFIVAKDGDASGERQYSIITKNTGTNTFKFNICINSDCSADMTCNPTDTTTYSVGTWYHVCGVYNDVDMRVYVNGSLDSTPTPLTTGICNTNTAFGIGHRIAASTFPFDGLIDEVIILDRALSPTEVSEIYTYGIDGTNGGND